MNTPGEKVIWAVYSLITNFFGEQKIEDAISNVVFKNANNNILFFDF
jgi:CBS domain-containing protein